jgi:hypothetical protein
MKHKEEKCSLYLLKINGTRVQKVNRHKATGYIQLVNT